ncbi:hypothetical protein C4K00_0431 [Pseudomonas synxantha]|uniref:Uncharacterized protein n=1 Tax=Pseudomonas khavaziana TaxID=2842351 RepID=A0ABZ2DGK2_9PSED|nr:MULTISPECIES: hypothetical protein [Pseudomonas]AZE58854.1 hypothetical protein C4K02_0462 [Pseudomonas synxantha]AZE70690.1 hypothetical protein C4K00_0431 [Pseudomonas synxantha]AZE76233.1 hypothetical protein C4J99_0418 [Pseudomonas synxantha]MBV4480171.1 hypothetical protein [Pseudomonas khavaziana]
MTPEAEKCFNAQRFFPLLSAARVEPLVAMHDPTRNSFFSLEIQKP